MSADSLRANSYSAIGQRPDPVQYKSLQAALSLIELLRLMLSIYDVRLLLRLVLVAKIVAMHCSFELLIAAQ